MQEDHARRPHMDAPIRRTRTNIDIAAIVATTRVARWAGDIPRGIEKPGLRPA